MVDRIDRVLVVLRGAEPGALRAAAAAAARSRAAVEALLVEDEMLLALAALPFARLVDPVSGRASALEPGRVDRAWRLHRARLARLLEDATRPHRLRSRVRVVRGRFAAEARAAAAGAGVVFLAPAPGGERPVDVGPPVRPGRPARPRVREFATRRPVRVFWDRAEGSRRALALAAEIALERGTSLRVLVPRRDDDPGARSVESALAGILGPGAPPVRCEEVEGDAPETLMRALAARPAEVIVLPRDVAAGLSPGAFAVLASMTCPVALVA